MGILILALLSGSIAAAVALIMGQTLLMALALYVACGLLGAGLAVGLALAAVKRQPTERASVPQPSLN